MDGQSYSLSDEVSEATTDEQGKFVIGNVPQGHMSLRARLEGYYQLEPLAVTSSPKSDVQIRMTRTGSIKGRVVDEIGNPIITGGIVSVDPPGDPVGKWGGSGQFKPDGSFEFESVPPGTYHISAAPNPRRGEPTTKPIEVKAGETTSMDIEISAQSVAPGRRTR
jgi:hypothetical protein